MTDPGKRAVIAAIRGLADAEGKDATVVALRELRGACDGWLDVLGSPEEIARIEREARRRTAA